MKAEVIQQRSLLELADLDAAIAALPLMFMGSRGQLKPNPLIAEARSHRLVLNKLLTSLGLTDAVEEAQRSAAARRMALQRWRRTG